jgi:hypothetical protein
MNIASILGTGPEMYIYKSFDIIVYPQEIIWIMEMCYTEDNILKYMPTGEAVESYSRHKD